MSRLEELDQAAALDDADLLRSLTAPPPDRDVDDCAGGRPVAMWVIDPQSGRPVCQWRID